MSRPRGRVGTGAWPQHSTNWRSWGGPPRAWVASARCAMLGPLSVETLMPERAPHASGRRGQTLPAWPLLPALAVLFLAVGLAQVWPQWGMAPHFLPGDDWTAYHNHAQDILAHGLALPMVQGVYSLPAGFLYNYFVALCYVLAGPRPEAVYLVQSAMLGVTVWLLYAAFAPDLGRRAGLFLLGALIVFALADVQRHYAPRLLSENLVLPLVALFFRLLLSGRPWGPVWALGALGAIPLTRPNAMIFIPPLLAWLALSRRGRELIAPRRLALGLALFALVFSTLGLRNHAATGRWVFFTPTAWEMFEVPGYGLGLKGAPRDGQPGAGGQGPLSVLGLVARAFTDHPAATAEAYARRLLYCLGFMPLIEPAFQYRPHWVLAWALYLAGLARALALRRPLGPAQTVLALYVWPMLAVVVGVAWVANYGFRFQVPIVLPMLAGAAWGLETLAGRGGRRDCA